MTGAGGQTGGRARGPSVHQTLRSQRGYGRPGPGAHRAQPSDWDWNVAPPHLQAPAASHKLRWGPGPQGPLRCSVPTLKGRPQGLPLGSSHWPHGVDGQGNRSPTHPNHQWPRPQGELRAPICGGSTRGGMADSFTWGRPSAGPPCPPLTCAAYQEAGLVVRYQQGARTHVGLDRWTHSRWRLISQQPRDDFGPHWVPSTHAPPDTLGTAHRQLLLSHRLDMTDKVRGQPQAQPLGGPGCSGSGLFRPNFSRDWGFWSSGKL